jgi:hypothetical protein
MPNRYFKPHKRFDLNPHPYDIGVFTGLKKGYEDNLFIKRLFELPEEEYGPCYQYHLAYFLDKQPESEQAFFSFVWQIAQRRVKFLEHKDPFHSSHALDIALIDKLQSFQRYLRSIDRWDTQMTLPEIIADQQDEIRQLKEQVGTLKEEIKAARKLETDYYINITEGKLLAVIDLLKKIEELRSDGKELAFAQFQIIWAKMICRYFRHGGKEIKFETVRRYFPGDKDNPSARSSPVRTKYQLFNIVPIKKERRL